MDSQERVTRIMRLREGGHVERTHTVPHHGAYSVGKHTFDMLLLLDALHPCPPLRLYQAVLRHDLHERWTGDMPATVKRLEPRLYEANRDAAEKVEDAVGIDVPDLTIAEHQWMAALDTLEFYLWSLDQVNMGNEHARRCVERAELWLRTNPVPVEVGELVRDIQCHGWQRTEEL